MSCRVAILLLAVVAVASAGTVVYPGQGWSFAVDKGTGGTGRFVFGPTTPPLGGGSVELSADGNNAEMFYNLGFGGVKFSSITALSYSTYRASGDAAPAIALQFDLDLNLNDSSSPWIGRIVYEPYLSHTVLSDTWQTWDTLEGKSWWFSHDQGVCDQGHPCTWTEVLAAFPNAGVLSGGATLFRSGSSWVNFDGNVDNFTIGIGESVKTLDFEPAPEPATWSMFAIGGGLVALARRRRRA